MEKMKAAEMKEKLEIGMEPEAEKEEMAQVGTLEEFLFENPVSDDTEELVLCKRLERYTFKIGSMSREERKKYLDACMIRAKNGAIVKQDLTKFNELVVLNHCLYPNFKSVDFVRRCGCNTPAEAMYKVLKIGEVERLSQKIMEFNGFDDFEDMRKQAKN